MHLIAVLWSSCLQKQGVYSRFSSLLLVTLTKLSTKSQQNRQDHFFYLHAWSMRAEVTDTHVFRMLECPLIWNKCFFLPALTQPAGLGVWQVESGPKREVLHIYRNRLRVVEEMNRTNLSVSQIRKLHQNWLLKYQWM